MPARALIRGVSFGLAMWCATGVLILAPLGAVAWPARPIGSVASGSWQIPTIRLGLAITRPHTTMWAGRVPEAHSFAQLAVSSVPTMG